MRIELIQPLHAVYGKLGKRDSFIFRPAQLTMPYLAALTPPDVEVSISDEMVEPIIFQKEADLVGITFVTPFAYRAYELASLYRRNGKTVVMGGPHASLLPEEVKKHSDAVVIGEAEDTWPMLIEDFKNNRLKPFYKSNSPELHSIPHARRDLLKREKYIIPDIIQATRGCPFSCTFCAGNLIAGKKLRKEQPMSPVAYTLLRMGIWLEITDHPAAKVPEHGERNGRHDQVAREGGRSTANPRPVAAGAPAKCEAVDRQEMNGPRPVPGPGGYQQQGGE